MKQVVSAFARRALATGIAALGLGMSAQTWATPMLPSATQLTIKYTDYSSLFTPSGTVIPGTTPPSVGDVFTEIFAISSIAQAANPSNVYWASDVTDGTQLLGVATDLKVTSVGVGPTFPATYSGGTTTIFEVPKGSFSPGAPSTSLAALDAQVCPTTGCPAPFLTLNFVPGIIPGDATDSLSTTTTALTAPFTGSGAADLLVTGGSFASHLTTTGSLETDFASCAGATGAFANLCSAPGSTWPDVSNDPVTLTTRTVPEPGSAALLGLGLSVMACSRRRVKRR
ncbi:MAG: PEP-CTERM sorting domain-containing protein [Betaproteobacteria bacterium]|nr:PEP-CTERM sorting domain-containing protein [Betaproteobacteria bacterium]